MRSLIRKIALLFIIYIAAVGILFAVGEKELDFYIEAPSDGGEVSFSLDNEDVLTIKERSLTQSGYEHLRLSKVNDGDAVLTVDFGNESDSSVVYFSFKSGRFGIIDLNSLSFSLWQYAALFTWLLFAGITAILLIEFYKDMKENMYSYFNIACLGAALFLLIIVIVDGAILINAVTAPEKITVYRVLAAISSSTRHFMLYTSPVIIILSIALCVSNILLCRHEGACLINTLGLIAGIIFIIGSAVGIYLCGSDIIFSYKNLLCNVYSALYGYFECFLLSTIACVIISARHEPKYDKDYVLILGCQVRADGTLYPIVRSRVDRAIEFVNKEKSVCGKQAIYLPTGGKGSDEQMSEGDAMHNYLRKHNVSEDNILVENKSVNTQENLIFSREIINKRSQGGNLAFSTSDFHVFRSGIIANELGIPIEGMGSPTKWYFWPNAFLREYVALFVKSAVWQAVILIGIIIAACALCLIVGL